MQFKKILLCITLMASMILPQLPVLGAEEYPKAVLNSAAASETLIDVWAGESKVTPATSTVGGKTGWKADRTNENSAKNIFCNVDDSYIYNCIEGSEDYGYAVEVDVEYYDGEAGLFNIVYDSVHASDYGRPANTSEGETPVQLTGTNTWKTHTFKLYDMRFANGYKNADFLIRTYNAKNYEDCASDAEYQASVEYHNMYYKAGDIVFGSISVRKIPIIATLESGMLGNIFFGAGNKDVVVDFRNTTDTAIDTTVVYELVSVQTNETLWSKSENLKLASKGNLKKNLSIPFEKYGTHMLNISTNAAGGVSATKREIECSLVVDNDGIKDERFGINTHIWDLSNGNGRYAEELTDFVEKSGSGWIREPLRWNSVEWNKAGVRSIPDAAMKTIDEYVEKDIDILMILHGTNSLYEGAKSLPFDAEALKAYEEYCYFVAKSLKGKVDTFETWNEFNYNAYGIDAYMDILKATYNGVKRGNPDAKIVGGCVSFAKSWTEHIYRALGTSGAMEYMTALSNHPYATVGPDENDLGYDMQWVRSIMNEYDAGKDLELWISELGWSNAVNHWGTGSNIENFTEELSAAYQVQVYCHTIGRGSTEKFMVYDLMNDNYQQGGKEGNMGLLESRFGEENVPFAAKPGYIGATFMTHMLHDAEPKGYTYKNNNYRYTYNKADGSALDVAWNYNGSGSIDVVVPAYGKTVIYDIYGNVMKTLVGSQTYALPLTKIPVYILHTPSDYSGLGKDVIVEDNFNGTTLDLTKWNDVRYPNVDKGSSIVSGTSYGADGKVLKLGNATYNNFGVKPETTLSDGILNVKFDVYLPGQWKDEVKFYVNDHNKSTLLWLQNGGVLKFANSLGDIATLTPNAWNTIDYKVNLQTGETTTIVTLGDSEKTVVAKSGIYNDANIINALKAVNSVQLIRMYNASDVFIDNISISNMVDSPVFSYDVDKENKEVNVSARLASADKGKNATFFVMRYGSTFDDLDTNPLESVVYVGQGTVDNDGLYSVDYKLPEEAGVYTAYLAFDGYDERYEMNIVVGGKYAAVLSVTQNGQQIKKLSDLNAQNDMNVNVKGYNETGVPVKFKLVYAYYNNEVLTGVKINDINSSEVEFDEFVTAEGPLNGGKEFDQVKVFLWNSLDDLASQCKNLCIE